VPPPALLDDASPKGAAVATISCSQLVQPQSSPAKDELGLPHLHGCTVVFHNEPPAIDQFQAFLRNQEEQREATEVFAPDSRRLLSLNSTPPLQSHMLESYLTTQLMSTMLSTMQSAGCLADLDQQSGDQGARNYTHLLGDDCRDGWLMPAPWNRRDSSCCRRPSGPPVPEGNLHAVHGPGVEQEQLESIRGASEHPAVGAGLGNKGAACAPCGLAADQARPCQVAQGGAEGGAAAARTKFRARRAPRMRKSLKSLLDLKAFEFLAVRGWGNLPLRQWSQARAR
jgi:hypothetical protein